MSGSHSLNYEGLFSTQEVSLLDALLDGVKSKETQSPVTGIVLRIFGNLIKSIQNKKNRNKTVMDICRETKLNIYLGH